LLVRQEPSDLSPESPIAEIVRQFSTVPRVADSLHVVEIVMGLEEEIGATIPDGMVDSDGVIFRVVLGPRASQCTWAHETLRARSIRGVIEERVRIRGDCTCP